MIFNVLKCNGGYGNPTRLYKINGKEIESSSQKRDQETLNHEDIHWDG